MPPDIDLIAVNRSLGKVEGSLEAAHARLNKHEDDNKDIWSEMRRGFAEIRAEMSLAFGAIRRDQDDQNKKLDTLLERGAYAAGATGVWKLLRNSTFQLFVAILSSGIIVSFCVHFIKW